MNSKYLVFAGMGVELIGIILACLYIGQMLDEKYGLKGLAMIGLSVCGLAGWIYHIILMTQKFDKEPGE